MATNDPSLNGFDLFCDRVIFFSLCAVIFFLPASIAYLDSFAALAAFFYLLKKAVHTFRAWPYKASQFNLPQWTCFIWRSFYPRENCLNLPLRFLTLSIAISVLFSQYPGLGLMAFFGKFVKSLFLYFSFLEVFNDRRRIHIFLGVFLLSAFIAALSGVVQHFTGRDFIKGHVIATENFVSTQRITSTFFGANGFGAYLLPVFGLVAHFFFTALSRPPAGGLGWTLRGSLTILLVLILACLCWTYSRSSWLGYLTIAFAMLVLDRKKWMFVLALLLIFIFIFLPSLNHVRKLALVNDNQTGMNRENESFLGNITPSKNTGSGRFAYWNKALSIIRLSPLWGSGFNTYGKMIRREADKSTWWYAHNCYLQMAAETGILGLGCLLWLLFVLFWHGLKSSGAIEDAWMLTILQGALSGLFGFLVQSFFDNTFYTVQLGVLMWLMFGLIMAVTKLDLR
jgi:putative inorganic carbon (HCO3(-)) transporter